MKGASDSFPRNTLRQAEMVKNGWKNFLDDLNVPNLSIKEFEKIIEKASEQVDLAERLKEERSEAVKSRNDYLKELWDLTKRIRNAAKATFGDNAEEIEHFGGKSSRTRGNNYEE